MTSWIATIDAPGASGDNLRVTSREWDRCTVSRRGLRRPTKSVVRTHWRVVRTLCMHCRASPPQRRLLLSEDRTPPEPLELRPPATEAHGRYGHLPRSHGNGHSTWHRALDIVAAAEQPRRTAQSSRRVPRMTLRRRAFAPPSSSCAGQLPTSVPACRCCRSGRSARRVGAAHCTHSAAGGERWGRGGGYGVCCASAKQVSAVQCVRGSSP